MPYESNKQSIQAVGEVVGEGAVEIIPIENLKNIKTNEKTICFLLLPCASDCRSLSVFRYHPFQDEPQFFPVLLPCPCYINVSQCSGIEAECQSCKDNLQAPEHNSSSHTSTQTHSPLSWQYVFDLSYPRSKGSYKIFDRSLSTKVGDLLC